MTPVWVCAAVGTSGSRLQGRNQGAGLGEESEEKDQYLTMGVVAGRGEGLYTGAPDTVFSLRGVRGRSQDS